MTAQASSFRIRQRLATEWSRIQVDLARLGNVSISPADDTRILKLSPDARAEEIAIDFGPVVFNVPERGTHLTNRLFIYIDGTYRFRRSAWEGEGEIETIGVQSKAAYFRLDSAGTLCLVHGVHFDHDPIGVGHPIFHMQHRGNFDTCGVFVRTECKIGGKVTSEISKTLRNVRSASAQLDAFSVILQVAADHLLPQSPTPDQRHAFNAMLSRGMLCCKYCCAGEPQRAPESAPTGPFRCFRARHWYRRI